MGFCIAFGTKMPRQTREKYNKRPNNTIRYKVQTKRKNKSLEIGAFQKQAGILPNEHNSIYNIW